MSSATVLAFDLGGTRLKLGLVSGDRVRAGTPVATNCPGAAALELLFTHGAALCSGHSIDGVALALPGLVEDGRVVHLPGKLEGIAQVDLQRLLAERFRVPSLVTNDAVAYGVGEAVFGGGRGHDGVLVLTIGTGVGVAMIERGAPSSARRAGGGILGGHIPISELPSQWVDSNGKTGTIEALCAARRLVDYASEEGGHFESVPAVYAAYRARAVPAQRAVERFRDALTRSIVALAHAHGPTRVVVGGGAMPADSPVFDGLAQSVNARLWGGYSITLAPAALGDYAALAGLGHLHARRYPPSG